MDHSARPSHASPPLLVQEVREDNGSGAVPAMLDILGYCIGLLT